MGSKGGYFYKKNKLVEHPDFIGRAL